MPDLPAPAATDTKPWYESRIIWLQVVTFVIMLAKMAGLHIPAGIDPDQVVNTIMLAVPLVGSIATIVLRLRATKQIAPASAPK